jgi:hypothetical protein
MWNFGLSKGRAYCDILGRVLALRERGWAKSGGIYI